MKKIVYYSKNKDPVKIGKLINGGEAWTQFQLEPMIQPVGVTNENFEQLQFRSQLQNPKQEVRSLKKATKFTD